MQRFAIGLTGTRWLLAQPPDGLLEAVGFAALALV
jgi:hypothetical protein